MGPLHQSSSIYVEWYLGIIEAVRLIDWQKWPPYYAFILFTLGKEIIKKMNYFYLYIRDRVLQI